MIKLRRKWAGATAALLVAGVGFGITAAAAVAAPSPAAHHSPVTSVGATGQAVNGSPASNAARKEILTALRQV